MKIVILANDDLTSNVIFAPLLQEQHTIDVAAVVFSKSPVRRTSSPITGALALLSKMDFRYWLFLAFTNGLFQVFVALTSLLGLSPSKGPLVSLRAIAARRAIPVLGCDDFNGDAIKAFLAETGVDLLLIRIGTILDGDVLAIPRRGIWCVHSSILPGFGGIAGEFHALRTGADRVGSTVFIVTEKLDGGEPLAQVCIERREGGSVFEHMIANNWEAGKLLREIVTTFAGGGEPRRRLLNAGVVPSYFSWPSSRAVDEFRRTGGRLIKLREAVALLQNTLRLGGK